MKLVYLAGPYSAPSREGVARNIAAARVVAAGLWEQGDAVISPHLNTAHFGDDCGATDEHYREGYLEILSRCDRVVLLPGWESSPGTRREVERAGELGIRVFELTAWHAEDLERRLARLPKPEAA